MEDDAVNRLGSADVRDGKTSGGTTLTSFSDGPTHPWLRDGFAANPFAYSSIASLIDE